MLVLSRKVGERIRIGDEITITVVRLFGGAVRIGVEAPQDMMIVREELLSGAQDAQSQSAQAADRSSSTELL